MSRIQACAAVEGVSVGCLRGLCSLSPAAGWVQHHLSTCTRALSTFLIKTDRSKLSSNEMVLPVLQATIKSLLYHDILIKTRDYYQKYYF